MREGHREQWKCWEGEEGGIGRGRGLYRIRVLVVGDEADTCRCKLR